MYHTIWVEAPGSGKDILYNKQMRTRFGVIYLIVLFAVFVTFYLSLAPMLTYNQLMIGRVLVLVAPIFIYYLTKPK